MLVSENCIYKIIPNKNVKSVWENIRRKYIFAAMIFSKIKIMVTAQKFINANQNY